MPLYPGIRKAIEEGADPLGFGPNTLKVPIDYAALPSADALSKDGIFFAEGPGHLMVITTSDGEFDMDDPAFGDIHNRIAAQHTFVVGDVLSGLPSTSPLHWLTIAVVELENGFVLVGQSIPADPEAFNRQEGADRALDDAMNKAGIFEVYLAKDRAWRDLSDGRRMLETPAYRTDYEPAPEPEPTEGMEGFQSHKRVLAGEITEVVPAGCYVKQADGTAVLRHYQPGMTARYQPQVGDFWIVYEGGYQSISPRQEFLGGYAAINPQAESDPGSLAAGQPAP